MTESLKTPEKNTEKKNRSKVVKVTAAGILCIILATSAFLTFRHFSPAFADSEASKLGPKYVAHRGLSGSAPENTLPAFELAGQNGYWGAECDVFNTSDGKFVIMHDETLDRTTNGKGKVADKTFSEIRDLKIVFGSNIKDYPGLKVPTLEEYLECCNKYNLVPFIEIKSFTDDEFYTKFMKILDDNNLTKKAFVISFNNDALKKVRQASKTIKLGMLTSYDLKLAKELKNCFFDLTYKSINGNMVKEAKQNGFGFGAWTVNDQISAKNLAGMGVKYITTDRLTGNE